MHDGTTARSRELLRGVWVSTALAIALSCLSPNRAQAFERKATSTAELSVSVSVVRSCALQAPAVMTQDAQLSDAVSLSCSNGQEPVVYFDAPSSAWFAQLDKHVAAAEGSAAEPVVVTVLF